MLGSSTVPSSWFTPQILLWLENTRWADRIPASGWRHQGRRWQQTPRQPWWKRGTTEPHSNGGGIQWWQAAVGEVAELNNPYGAMLAGDCGTCSGTTGST